MTERVVDFMAKSRKSFSDTFPSMSRAPQAQVHFRRLFDHYTRDELSAFPVSFLVTAKRRREADLMIKELQDDLKKAGPIGPEFPDVRSLMGALYPKILENLQKVRNCPEGEVIHLRSVVHLLLDGRASQYFFAGSQGSGGDIFGNKGAYDRFFDVMQAYDHYVKNNYTYDWETTRLQARSPEEGGDYREYKDYERNMETHHADEWIYREDGSPHKRRSRGYCGMLSYSALSPLIEKDGRFPVCATVLDDQESLHQDILAGTVWYRTSLKNADCPHPVVGPILREEERSAVEAVRRSCVLGHRVMEMLCGPVLLPVQDDEAACADFALRLMLAEQMPDSPRNRTPFRLRGMQVFGGNPVPPSVMEKKAETLSKPDDRTRAFMNRTLVEAQEMLENVIRSNEEDLKALRAADQAGELSDRDALPLLFRNRADRGRIRRILTDLESVRRDTANRLIASNQLVKDGTGAHHAEAPWFRLPLYDLSSRDPASGLYRVYGSQSSQYMNRLFYYSDRHRNDYPRTSSTDVTRRTGHYREIQFLIQGVAADKSGEELENRGLYPLRDGIDDYFRFCYRPGVLEMDPSAVPVMGIDAERCFPAPSKEDEPRLTEEEESFCRRIADEMLALARFLSCCSEVYASCPDEKDGDVQCQVDMLLKQAVGKDLRGNQVWRWMYSDHPYTLTHFDLDLDRLRAYDPNDPGKGLHAFYRGVQTESLPASAFAPPGAIFTQKAVSYLAARLLSEYGRSAFYAFCESYRDVRMRAPMSIYETDFSQINRRICRIENMEPAEIPDPEGNQSGPFWSRKLTDPESPDGCMPPYDFPLALRKSMKGMLGTEFRSLAKTEELSEYLKQEVGFNLGYLFTSFWRERKGWLWRYDARTDQRLLHNPLKTFGPYTYLFGRQELFQSPVRSDGNYETMRHLMDPEFSALEVYNHLFGRDYGIDEDKAMAGVETLLKAGTELLSDSWERFLLRHQGARVHTGYYPDNGQYFRRTPKRFEESKDLGPCTEPEPSAPTQWLLDTLPEDQWRSLVHYQAQRRMKDLFQDRVAASANRSMLFSVMPELPTRYRDPHEMDLLFKDLSSGSEQMERQMDMRRIEGGQTDATVADVLAVKSWADMWEIQTKYAFSEEKDELKSLTERLYRPEVQALPEFLRFIETGPKRGNELLDLSLDSLVCEPTDVSLWKRKLFSIPPMAQMMTLRMSNWLTSLKRELFSVPIHGDLEWCHWDGELYKRLTPDEESNGIERLGMTGFQAALSRDRMDGLWGHRAYRYCCEEPHIPGKRGVACHDTRSPLFAEFVRLDGMVTARHPLLPGGHLDSRDAMDEPGLLTDLAWPICMERYAGDTEREALQKAVEARGEGDKAMFVTNLRYDVPPPKRDELPPLLRALAEKANPKERERRECPENNR